MNDANYRITLDVHARQAQYNLNAKQGDTARKIIASFTEDGMPYAITSDMTAKMFINKPDGTTIMADCEISGYPDEVSGEGTDNSRATYTFSTQTCAAVGIAECEIRLYGVNNEILCSPRFNIVVDERVVDDYAALSEDEHSLLDGMLTDIQTVIEALGGKEDTANKMDSETFPDSAHDDDTYPTTKVLENVRSELLEVITTIAPGSIPVFESPNVWDLPNGVSYVAGVLRISHNEVLEVPMDSIATVIVSRLSQVSVRWLVSLGNDAINSNLLYTGGSFKSGPYFYSSYSKVEKQSNKVSVIDDSTEHYPNCKAVKDYVAEHSGVVDTELDNDSMNAIANAPVASAIETLNTTVGGIESDVDELNTTVGGIESDVDELTAAVSDITSIPRSPFTELDETKFNNMHGIIRTFFRSLFHCVTIKVTNTVQLAAGTDYLICKAAGAWSLPENDTPLTSSRNATAYIKPNGEMHIIPIEAIAANSNIVINDVYYSAPSADEYKKNLTVDTSHLSNVVVTDFFGNTITPGTKALRAKQEFFVTATVASGYTLLVENANAVSSIPGMYVVNGDVNITTV